MECVGCADRSAYDLSQHTKSTGVRLVAEKKLPEPKTIDVVEVVAIKGAVGKSFKKEAKDIMEALSKLEPAAVVEVEESLKNNGKYVLEIGANSYVMTPDMVEVKRYQKTMHVEEYVPNVIEPSFGIGRIMYSIFEHNFRVRSDDGQRTVSKYVYQSEKFHISLRVVRFLVFLATSGDCPIEMLGASVEQQCRFRSLHPSTV